MTPLIWSAKEGHINVVTALLLAGADTEAKDMVSNRMCKCKCVFERSCSA